MALSSNGGRFGIPLLLHVAEAVAQKRLNPKYFWKYMDNKLVTQTFLGRANELYEAAEQRRRTSEQQKESSAGE